MDLLDRHREGGEPPASEEIAKVNQELQTAWQAFEWENHGNLEDKTVADFLGVSELPLAVVGLRGERLNPHSKNGAETHNLLEDMPEFAKAIAQKPASAICPVRLHEAADTQPGRF